MEPGTSCVKLTKLLRTSTFQLALVYMTLFATSVFILLGLFDVWVPRERIAPHLGEASGIRGIVLAVLLGASSAGPLYVAFPVAEVMLRKGTSLRNIFIFLGSWSSMRLPMVLFEIQSVGPVFALSRFAASLAGILLMGVLLERLLGLEVRQEILERFEK